MDGGRTMTPLAEDRLAERRRQAKDREDAFHATIKDLRNQLNSCQQRAERLQGAGIANALTDLADAICFLPGLEWVLIQQQESIAEEPTIPVSGSPGVRYMATRRRTNFRVFIKTNAGPFAEREHTSLEGAVTAVFEALGIKLPPAIAQSLATHK